MARLSPAMTAQTSIAATDFTQQGFSSPFAPREEDDFSLREDSPPGLTASGSSDDGSSPSSASEQQQRKQQQQQQHQQQEGNHLRGVTNTASSKASSETAFSDAMSPWSNSDALDVSHEMEWISPYNHASTEHSFAAVTPSGSAHSYGHPVHASIHSSSSASPQLDRLQDTESKTALRAASQMMAQGNRIQGQPFGHSPIASSSTSSSAMWGGSQKTSNNSDEQMFDSIIEEDSFGPPSTSTSDYTGSPPPSSLRPGERNLSSVFDALRIPGAGSASPSASWTQPIKVEPHETSPEMLVEASRSVQEESADANEADPSAEYSVSRLPSIDAAKATIGREQRGNADSSASANGGHHSPNSYSDGEVTFSASTVVRPEVDGLADLQIHVHGIAARGAKSRVETQIKAHLELVRPRSDPGQAGTAGWDRVGSFTHLKLPPLSATKRKTKKNQQSVTEIPKEKTLYLDVAVVNASPPHQRAFACQSCSEREKKRADRRKSGRAKSGPVPSEEEMRKLGIDPAASNAAELAAERLTQEESKRIILFNCGDYLEFKDGRAELPTRITCYCRHHKEKLGFCILFTMRNWKGKTVACGSTPAIMITDDHKSSAALERSRREAAAAAAMPTSGQNGKSGSAAPSRQPSVSMDQSRATSLEASGSTEHQAAGGARSKQRKSRPKPYDGQRRSTISSQNGNSGGAAMTPLASSTGASSPNADQGTGSIDLVQALAAIGQERALLQQQQQPGPQHVASQPASQPVSQQQSFDFAQSQAQQQPHQETAMPLTGAQLPIANNLLMEGSISPDTLLTNPLSLPGLDFSNPAIAQQMLAILGSQGFVPRGSVLDQQQPQRPQQPAAVISKIIPGEGPTTGGIEVTVLGENFREGLTCFFGDLAASSTRVWASNTLICVLPPSPSPGPVAVTLKSAQDLQQQHHGGGFMPGRPPTGPLQLFTYVDKSDTQLMELALQVVGFQQTRTMQVPRDIALRLLASGQGSINSNLAAQQHQQQQQPYHSGQQHASRDAVAGFFAAAGTSGPTASGFQDTIIGFLGLLDVDNGVIPRRLDAIRLANTNGHTLLHLAASLGFTRLATKLLALGCPVNARDRNGLTALHLAVLNGRVGVSRILLEEGANCRLTSLNGHSALDIARHEDSLDLEQLLEEAAISSDVSDVSLRDAETIDDDNVSTSELEWSSDEDDDEGADPDEEDRIAQEMESNDATPRPASTPLAADAKCAAQSPMFPDEKRPEGTQEKLSEKSKLEKQYPTTLQSFANRIPGGFGFFGRNTGFQDRFFPHALQQRMQAIPVFHAAAPDHPTDLSAWTSSEAKTISKGKKSEEVTNTTAEDSNLPQHDHSRLMNLWKTFLEETGGLWTNSSQHPQAQPPPPAYEESAAEQNEGADGLTAESGLSRGQNISASASSSSGLNSSSCAGPSERRPKPAARRVSTSSLDSATSSTVSVPIASPLKAPRQRRMAVEDDWMLRWFWLPCLFVALLVAAFSTGPLSLAALATYIPQLGRL